MSFFLFEMMNDRAKKIYLKQLSAREFLKRNLIAVLQNYFLIKINWNWQGKNL